MGCVSEHSMLIFAHVAIRAGSEGRFVSCRPVFLHVLDKMPIL
jgi:hypothetical protein